MTVPTGDDRTASVGGATTSLWNSDVDLPAYPALGADLEADVCIVGAGIAGLSTAYLLGREGKRVVVLDDGPIGGGETGRTTAHLACALDDRFTEIERMHGEKGSRLAGESHRAAIDRIEAIVRAESIACDFERVDGYLFVPAGESRDVLEREIEAARRAGVAVEWAERAPLPGLDTGRCLRFPDQGQFHPLRYLAALARAVERDGGRIFGSTHAEAITGGEPARVKSRAGFEVRARAVVVATNTPVQDMVAVHTKQAAYRTYAMAHHVEAGSVPHALFWDTVDPYHYVRVARSGGNEFLIVGGEDHKTGQGVAADESWARLVAWTKERFPEAGAVEARWSGQVMETVDGLAFIGRNPLDKNNVFIATGDSGMGMTHGTIAGILITDLILGRANPWETLYDPSRKTLRASSTFAYENLNVAVQYADWVTPGDVGTADEIAPGDGKVLRRGLKKVAVHRDDDGRLHELSAVCPHLGCIVGWNPAEKTWDCPCHGSRFDGTGRVLNGPANVDLHEVEHES
jgi:glycine/D-amino acid oxidase-like deaminating enzyme/nitrite reductase/ring-hydroxylating ferredoxin subunit